MRLLLPVLMAALLATSCQPPVDSTSVLSFFDVEQSETDVTLTWAFAPENQLVAIVRGPSESTFPEQLTSDVSPGPLGDLTVVAVTQAKSATDDLNEVACGEPVLYAIYVEAAAGFNQHSLSDSIQRERRTWYRDEDGDGIGDPNERIESCDQPEGYVTDAGPCEPPDDTLGIHGNGGWCLGQIMTFHVPTTESLTFAWEVNGEAEILSEQGDASVQVRAGSDWSFVRVTMTNLCGESSTMARSVSETQTSSVRQGLEVWGITTTATGELLVADAVNSRVVRFDSVEDPLPEAHGPYPLAELTLVRPADIVPSGAGYWITDNYMHELIHMDNFDGENMTLLGAPNGQGGSDVGEFSSPMGLAVDGDGLLVADSNNHRVVRLTDISGAGWQTLSDFGAGDSLFNPSDVAILADGRLLVLDSGNDRLVAFDDLSGANPEILTPAGMTPSPTPMLWSALSVAPTGEIALSDVGADQIVVLESWQNPTATSFGDLGGAFSPLDAPRGLAWLDGVLLIGDTTNFRLIRVPCLL